MVSQRKNSLSDAMRTVKSKPIKSTSNTKRVSQKTPLQQSLSNHEGLQALLDSMEKNEECCANSDASGT